MNFSDDLFEVFSHKGSVKMRSYIVILALAASLPACSTVKVPDLVDLPEFREAGVDVNKLEYPDPMKAPDVPDDMRRAGEWDKAAKYMQGLKDRFEPPLGPETALTDTELKKEIEALKAKVKEYKLDDPVE